MDQNWTLSPLEGGRDRELRWSTSPSVNSRTLRMGNLMPNPALCINDFVFSSSSLRACPGITMTSQLRFKWPRPCLQETSSLFIVGFLITLSGLPPALYPKYIAFYLVKPSWKNDSVNGGHIISHNVPPSTCIFKSHVQQVLTHVWREIMIISLCTWVRTCHTIITLPVLILAVHLVYPCSIEWSGFMPGKALRMGHSWNLGLPSAATSGSRPLFQKCPVLWALPTTLLLIVTTASVFCLQCHARHVMGMLRWSWPTLQWQYLWHLIAYAQNSEMGIFFCLAALRFKPNKKGSNAVRARDI
jgi:hypothetical protein